MGNLWRLFVSVIIALPLTFLTLSAHSAPVSITQITASNFLELGVDKMRRGNYQEAIENFNQTIELEKDFAVAYSDRCLAYLQLQDYHQAIADCTQAINFAPDDFEAYLNRGLALYREGDYLNAYRGIARYRLGYHLDAIADLQKASKYFHNQGKRVAYQKTLDLLKNLRQKISSVTEIALL